MIKVIELERLRRIHAAEMALFDLRGHDHYHSPHPFQLYLRDISKTDIPGMAEKWGVVEDAVLALILSDKLIVATIKGNDEEVRQLTEQLRTLITQ